MELGEGAAIVGRFRRPSPLPVAKAGPTSRTSVARAQQPTDDAVLPEPPSIRDRQRRRRAGERVRADVESLLAIPSGEDEDDEASPAGPPPPRVYVVFRGASWTDPDGALRESDTIVGVYATEDAARKAVRALERGAPERDQAWYQPYQVQA